MVSQLYGWDLHVLRRRVDSRAIAQEDCDVQEMMMMMMIIIIILYGGTGTKCTKNQK
jgi:hypothetical protein